MTIGAHPSPPHTHTCTRAAPQACAELGLPVRLEPPRLADAPRWDGAFVSSTSRLLLPADELRWAPPGHGAAGGTERVRAFDRSNKTVRELEAAVAARILRESEPLPSPCGGGSGGGGSSA
jgi:hypothetical protein